MGLRSAVQRGNYWRKGHTRACPTTFCRDRCKMAEPIDLPDGRAIWLHLSNSIKPSVCGDDAALCQITWTICSVFMCNCSQVGSVFVF